MSLVLLYLTYCNLVWACNSANKLKPVVVLQKRTVRNIAKVDYRAHTSPLFKKLGLLKVTDICCFQTALLSVQCNTLHGTEYKITCGVCLCVFLCVRTAFGGRISRKRL